MRILVFGASGVQGKAQVIELVRTGHHPVAVGRNFAGVALACENQTAPDFCDVMTATMRRRAALNVDDLISQMHKAYSWYNDDPSDPFVVDMDAVLKELPVHAPLLSIEEWARIKALPVTLPGK